MDRIIELLKKVYRRIHLGVTFAKQLLLHEMIFIKSNAWRKIAPILDDIDGPLTQKEMVWLYDFTKALQTDLPIIEVNPSTGQVTSCLALACWQSRRHIYSIWPEEISDPFNETAKQYSNWHKTIIRKNLVPFASPVLHVEKELIPCLPVNIGLLLINHDPKQNLVKNENIKDLLINLNQPVYILEYLTPEYILETFPQNIINKYGNFYLIKAQ